ncbi:hypothetical protein D3C71_1194990 [compost metagenome]
MWLCRNSQALYVSPGCFTQARMTNNQKVPNGAGRVVLIDVLYAHTVIGCFSCTRHFLPVAAALRPTRTTVSPPVIRWPKTTAGIRRCRSLKAPRCALKRRKPSSPATRRRTCPSIARSTPIAAASTVVFIAMRAPVMPIGTCRPDWILRQN